MDGVPAAGLISSLTQGHDSETCLLLEISPILFVDQDQVDVVPDRELLVDVLHGRGQVVATQE